MISSSTISKFLFSTRHKGLVETKGMYSGFFELNETSTLWIYFFDVKDVISGGSFDIFQIVMSSMQLIENVITHS
jgi:hypothetical protein